MIDYYKNLSLENLPYINEEGLICWEEFKDIPKYEGLYQVSDLGRVKSLGRVVISTLGKRDTKKERILKQFNNGKDYLSVQLYHIDSNRLYVHRLVALAFYGSSDLIVDHKNTIRTCNTLENLRYLTVRENNYERRNRPAVNSNFIGVTKSNTIANPWRTGININGEKYYLGSYKTEEEASDEYQNALYNWENFNLTPKGKIEIKKETKLFNNKSGNRRGENAKIVLDTNSGIFYECLKDACKALNLTYKHTSAMLIGSRVNKTSLIYV